MEQATTHNLIEYTPNIITGLVSIIVTGLALLFGYLQTKRTIKSAKENLDKQLQVQLATSIEKEWIEKVRGYIATCIENFILLDELRSRNVLSTVNVATLPEYNDAINRFRNSQILLSLYLNLKDKSHNLLYDKFTDMWGLCVRGDQYSQGSDLIKEIQNHAHEIFNRKTTFPVSK